MVAAVGLSTTSALAQETPPALDPGLMVGWAAGEAIQKNLDDRAGITRGGAAELASRQRGTPARSGPDLSSALSRPAPDAVPSLAYQPTSALRKQVLDAFIARARRSHPADADQMAAQFTRYDYSTVYWGLVSQYGLREDDTADAMTAYLVLGYLIANGIEAGPSVASVRAVRAQVAGALAPDPIPASADHRARRGEEMKILFVTLHSGWQSAHRERALDRYANGVAAMFRDQAAIDFTTMSLDNAGFRRRG